MRLQSFVAAHKQRQEETHARPGQPGGAVRANAPDDRARRCRTGTRSALAGRTPNLCHRFLHDSLVTQSQTEAHQRLVFMVRIMLFNRPFGEARGRGMSIFWIVVAAVAALGLLLFAVMDRAKQEDRRSRQIQRTISPFDDITITKE